MVYSYGQYQRSRISVLRNEGRDQGNKIKDENGNVNETIKLKTILGFILKNRHTSRSIRHIHM